MVDTKGEGVKKVRRPRYRALSTNGKNWVYGFPLLYEIYGENWIADEIGRKRNIKPETLGQYTGLKDKNEQEIFEGDFLSNGEHINWQVGFHDGSFKVMLTNPMNTDRWILNEDKALTREVVGNIWGNPELRDSW